MKAVFVDTAYWLAVTRPGDSLAQVAREARLSLGKIRLFTTDGVLTEFLNSLSGSRSELRMQGAKFVRAVLADSKVTVIPSSRQIFLQALDLYEKRPDKGYSLIDCASMNVMKAHGLKKVLTEDRHFEQEGYSVLIRK